MDSPARSAQDGESAHDKLAREREWYLGLAGFGLAVII